MSRKKPIEVEPGSGLFLARFTCHLPPDLADKIRDVAWWERRTVNDVVKTALEDYIAKLEKKRGEPYAIRAGVLRRGRMAAPRGGPKASERPFSIAGRALGQTRKKAPQDEN